MDAFMTSLEGYMREVQLVMFKWIYGSTLASRSLWLLWQKNEQ